MNYRPKASNTNPPLKSLNFPRKSSQREAKASLFHSKRFQIKPFLLFAKAEKVGKRTSNGW